MYSVNQPIKKVGVVPEKIMYEVEPVQGSVFDKLESAGKKVGKFAETHGNHPC